MNSVPHELGLQIKSNFIGKSIYKPQKPSLYLACAFRKLSFSTIFLIPLGINCRKQISSNDILDDKNKGFDFSQLYLYHIYIGGYLHRKATISDLAPDAVKGGVKMRCYS